MLNETVKITQVEPEEQIALFPRLLETIIRYSLKKKEEEKEVRNKPIPHNSESKLNDKCSKRKTCSLRVRNLVGSYQVNSYPMGSID